MICPVLLLDRFVSRLCDLGGGAPWLYTAISASNFTAQLVSFFLSWRQQKGMLYLSPFYKHNKARVMAN
jgi:hypothetical protein